MKKSRLSKLEAEYIAYQQAWAFTSVCNEKENNFYDELGVSQILDKSKLNKDSVFYPNDADIILISREMEKLSNKLLKKMREIRNKLG